MLLLDVREALLRTLSSFHGNESSVSSSFSSFVARLQRRLRSLNRNLSQRRGTGATRPSHSLSQSPKVTRRVKLLRSDLCPKCIRVFTTEIITSEFPRISTSCRGVNLITQCRQTRGECIKFQSPVEVHLPSI